MDRFDPFVKYADVYGDIINWEKDPMNKPQNQNKYFFSDGKTYYEQICKMLRLMSVFKEAFNQIYSNEDEISEAWENFVNNLSASVVEGSEPDVTLTWTDDSVNFEFTMVPGDQGEQGVGITSISFNSDYTMTITLSDGNTYTSMSLKGETGPQGPQGETGSGLQILDVYATLADLQSAHPTGQPGDAYQVGSGGSYTLYIWSSSQSAWVPAGSLSTVSPSTSNPLMNGTASAGSSDLYSRGDHVHPSDTSRASKEELDALIKTSQALIDQSFTYRKSPAIQDGLARIDKIKGNTLLWNQLVQNGNFADTSKWTENQGTISASNNVLTLTITSQNWSQNIAQTNKSVIANHKYLMAFDIQTSVASHGVMGRLYSSSVDTRTTMKTVNANTKTRIAEILTPTQSYTAVMILYCCFQNATESNGLPVGATVRYSNVMLIDLTKMGLDNITSVDEFTSLFSLPFYQFDSGSLLSFNGNGIKTVGKNLFDENSVLLSQGFVKQNDGSYYKESLASLTNAVIWSNDAHINGALSIRFKYKNISTAGSQGLRIIVFYTDDVSQTVYSPVASEFALLEHQTNSSKTVDKIVWDYGSSGNGTYIKDFIISVDNIGYEPYTSSTLSLPISAYFPTGMKRAGNVYDELTESKAISRIGRVDLGSLTWSYRESGTSLAPYFYATFMGVKYVNPNYEIANVLCAKYQTVRRTTSAFIDKTICMDGDSTRLTQIQIKDSSYTDTTAFKNSLQGQYLYYEMINETETAVDLDLDFMAYEDGTEQLLPVNGSVPSTSPIIADMTYLSIDDAMEYILDKLANVPQNTQQILESLEDDVTDLQTDVGALQTSVSGLQTSVGNINTNIGQISSTVAGHTASISDIQSDISDLNTGLSNLEDTVTDNTSRIGTLENGLSATNGNVQNLETSVSDLDDTVTAQGTTVTALDSIIQDISNNPVVGALGQHELGFVAAYVSATLAANTGTKVTIPKPVIFPNNYTPLFIVGMDTGSYNVSICSIPYSFGNRDSVDCRVWNHGVQQTTQITVYILCMRQKQSQ